MDHHLCALGGLALAQVLPKVADEQGGHAGDARTRAPQVEARVVDLVAAPQLLELGRAEQRQPRLVRAPDSGSGSGSGSGSDLGSGSGCGQG